MSQDSRPFQWHYGELDDKNFQLHGHNLLLLLLALLLVLLLACFFLLRKYCYPATSAAAAATAGGSDCEGMGEDAVKRLPVRVRAGEAAVCSICLAVVAEGEKERVLPGCSHGFHPVCVDEWLRKRSSCPLCRANVVGEEKVVALAPPEIVVATADVV